MFWKYHGEGVLKKYKPKLAIGSLDTKKGGAEPAPAPAPAAKPAPAPAKAPEEKKAAPAAAAAAAAPEPEALEPYGDLIPFADPNWYQGVSTLFPSFSPFFSAFFVPPSSTYVFLRLGAGVTRRGGGRGGR